MTRLLCIVSILQNYNTVVMIVVVVFVVSGKDTSSKDTSSKDTSTPHHVDVVSGSCIQIER